MSWTRLVICVRCDASDWHVEGGQWTCVCGKAMTVAEIKEMHDRERRSVPVASGDDAQAVPAVARPDGT